MHSRLASNLVQSVVGIEAPCPALAALKRDRESPKCKEIITSYCSSLANPVGCYGEGARSVEFPQGNPIKQGELAHFQDQIPRP